VPVRVDRRVGWSVCGAEVSNARANEADGTFGGVVAGRKDNDLALDPIILSDEAEPNSSCAQDVGKGDCSDLNALRARRAQS